LMPLTLLTRRTRLTPRLCPVLHVRICAHLRAWSAAHGLPCAAICCRVLRAPAHSLVLRARVLLIGRGQRAFSSSRSGRRVRRHTRQRAGREGRREASGVWRIVRAPPRRRTLTWPMFCGTSGRKLQPPNLTAPPLAQLVELLAAAPCSPAPCLALHCAESRCLPLPGPLACAHVLLCCRAGAVCASLAHRLCSPGP
jgi:hypothetical protein